MTDSHPFFFLVYSPALLKCGHLSSKIRLFEPQATLPIGCGTKLSKSLSTFFLNFASLNEEAPSNKL